MGTNMTSKLETRHDTIMEDLRIAQNCFWKFMEIWPFGHATFWPSAIDQERTIFKFQPWPFIKQLWRSFTGKLRKRLNPKFYKMLWIPSSFTPLSSMSPSGPHIVRCFPLCFPPNRGTGVLDSRPQWAMGSSLTKMLSFNNSPIEFLLDLYDLSALLHW